MIHLELKNLHKIWSKKEYNFHSIALKSLISANMHNPYIFDEGIGE